MSLAQSLKSCRALAVSLAITAFAVALAASGASANSDKHQTAKTRHAQHAYVAHRWRHVARRYPPAYNGGPNTIAGPGYVFVPGKGILDEACNLPTSTCPNTMRDTQ